MAKEITLDLFKPRDYQLDIIDALENKGVKRFVLVWSRRMGKDHISFYIAIRQLLRKVCTVFYIFPTAKQARIAIWDGINSDGQRIIEYIPKELIANKNDSDMKIRLINGSTLQFIGSSDVDRVRGTACYGAIFSEFATANPESWTTLRPVLAQNDGWAIFVSTPNGHNEFYSLYNMAVKSDYWYTSLRNINNTDYLSKEIIEQERAEMSEDKFLQEYECSWAAGAAGAYYAKYINNLRLNGQISSVPWDTSHKVSTSWDLGVRDSTAIVFFQVINNAIHVIDYYENNKEGLEHYVQIINSKPYVYNAHIAPHDIAVTEFSSGVARIDKARQLGIDFIVAPKLLIADGIEAVRTMLPRCFFDEIKCKQLVNSLDNYRQEWDDVRKVYKDRPRHDHHSNASDAFRMLAVSLSKIIEGLTPDDLDRIRAEAAGMERENYSHPFM